MSGQRKVVTKENGKFGLMRIDSGCVYGDFDTYGEALGALAECQVADASMREEG